MGKESIWNRLRELGFNEYASAGIMANIQAESAYISNRVQMGYGWTDEEYTSQVDNGTYTESTFLHDAIGYGLIQWTYWSRKQGLYDLAQRRNVSIGDEVMQLDFMYYELTTGYSAGLNKLLNATSAYDSAYWFCADFERPADTINQAVYRGNLAEQIYTEFAGTPVTATETQATDTTETVVVVDTEESEETETVGTVTHIVNYGDNDIYVRAMQWLLKAKGYSLEADGDFGPITKTCLMQFQQKCGITIDGICGSETWHNLTLG